MYFPHTFMYLDKGGTLPGRSVLLFTKIQYFVHRVLINPIYSSLWKGGY